MSKRLETRTDYNQIQRVIASSFDTSILQEGLEELGYEYEVDTVDWNQFGTISIEGGENETGCIITLKVVKLELGYDTINVGGEDDD